MTPLVHTPEPWQLRRLKTEAYVPGHAARAEVWMDALYGPNDEQIAVVSFNLHQADNARLLVSSPRLLRVLLDIAGEPGSDFPYANCNALNSRGRRGLNSAEGILRELGVRP